MPVWDKFLTEQDKKMLAAQKKRPAPPHAQFGERPAILVIDMNKGAIGEDRPIWEVVPELPGAMADMAWAAIRQMEVILPRARAAGIPVIYSKHFFKETTGLRESEPSSVYSSRNPLSEIQEEIAPQPGDLLVEKQRPSVFFQTGLIYMLLNKKIDSLILMGNSTSGCVRATAVDSQGYFFKTSLVEECTFDRIEFLHAASLFKLQPGVDIVNVGETLEFMASVKNGQRVAPSAPGKK